MYQLNDNKKITSDDCANCNKKSVCKYEEKFMKYKEQINQVDMGLLISPFHVFFKCVEYEKRRVIRESFTNDLNVEDFVFGGNI